jgi:hypothetical protein
MLSISGSALWRHRAEAVEVFGEADAAQGPGERPLPRETLEDLRTGRPSSAVEEFGEEVALRRRVERASPLGLIRTTGIFFA